MIRKFAALFVGGAILVGTVGVAGTASAQTSGLTPEQQTQVTQLLNRTLQQANQYCASNPTFALCRFLPKITQTEITNLVNRINSAVIRAGGVEAIKNRLAPVKSKLCANKAIVLARVPAQYRTQATTAINRLCAA